MDIGIQSLKIEGRTKSHYYAARTTQVYRRAIDDAAAGREFNMGLMNDLEKLASRGYTEGFYRRHPPGEYQNYEQGNSKSTSQQFVGEIIDVDQQKNQVVVDVKNRFGIGDQIELMTPAGNQGFTLGHMETERGDKMEVAPGSGHVVKIPLEANFDNIADLEYALLLKDL
jgi:putative protease